MAICWLGFRVGYSTRDVLLHVTESWLQEIYTGKCVGAIFLDFAKFFDCIILLQKIDVYGFNVGAYLWVKSLFFVQQNPANECK